MKLVQFMMPNVMMGTHLTFLHQLTMRSQGATATYFNAEHEMQLNGKALVDNSSLLYRIPLRHTSTCTQTRRLMANTTQRFEKNNKNKLKGIIPL